MNDLVKAIEPEGHFLVTTDSREVSLGPSGCGDSLRSPSYFDTARAALSITSATSPDETRFGDRSHWRSSGHNVSKPVLVCRLLSVHGHVPEAITITGVSEKVLRFCGIIF